MSDSRLLKRGMQVATSVIVNSLVEHDFVGVELMTHGRYVTAGELERAVAELGGTLIRAPASIYEQLTFTRVADVDPPTFETQVPLWTTERGKTRTTVILRFREREDIPDAVQPEVVGVVQAAS